MDPPRQMMNPTVPISLPVRQLTRLVALSTVSALNSIRVTAALPARCESTRKISARVTVRKR